jgi:Zn-dependent protease
MEKLALGVIWYFAFLFSVVFHEAAHALAALKLGDSTAYEGGQVTMNPVPHVRREPFGTIAVPILSFIMGGWMIGWASAPYNPHWALRYPKRSALMALAGPSANLIIVIVMFVFIRVGIGLNVFSSPATATVSHVTAATSAGVFAALAKFFSILFSLNLILFIFNLLPLPPLDGSGIIPLALDDDMARKYLDFIRNPAFMIIGLLAAWRLFDAVFDPIFTLALNLLYPGHGYH